MSKKLTIVILLGIIILGAFFRFYNITEKGFFISDESFFAIVEKTLAITPSVLADGILHHRDNLGAYIQERLWWGAQHTTARPGFIFPVAFLMMILGTHDYVPFVFNALLGALTILLVYLLGMSIFKSEKIALAASFLLAISNYHIFYSRTGLAQVTTAFFLALSVLLYLNIFNEKEIKFKNFFIIGLCWGYLLSTHQSVVPTLAIFFLFDFIFFGENFREKLKRLVYFGSGIISVIMFWEIILGARKLVANFFHLSENVHTYLEELSFLFFNNIGDWPANPDKLFYFDLLKRFDGWLIIALLFVGILVFILKKDWHDKKNLFLFSLTWFILIFWSLVPLKATRTMAIFVPILSLFCGYALVETLSVIKIKSYQISLVACFAIIIFVLNLTSTYQILNLKSGYKEVAVYLKNQNLNIKEIDAVGMGWLHYDFYLKQKFEAPHTIKNSRFLISDWGDKDSWQKFSQTGKLIAAFENPIGSFYPAIKDIYYGASAEFAEEIAQTSGIDKIGIFVVK